MNSIEFLDAVREEHDIDSDRKLARFLAVDRTFISNVRRGERKLSDKVCVKVAEALGFEPIYVMLHVQAERKSHDISVIWRRAADRVGKGTAAAVLLGLLVSGSLSPQQAHAAQFNGVEYTLYAVRLRRRLAALWGALVTVVTLRRTHPALIAQS